MPLYFQQNILTSLLARGNVTNYSLTMPKVVLSMFIHLILLQIPQRDNKQKA